MLIIKEGQHREGKNFFQLIKFNLLINSLLTDRVADAMNMLEIHPNMKWKGHRVVRVLGQQAEDQLEQTQVHIR